MLHPGCVEKGSPPWLGGEQQAVLGQWDQCWHDMSSARAYPVQKQPDWVSWVLVPPGNLGRRVVGRRWPEKENLMSLMALLQGATVL